MYPFQSDKPYLHEQWYAAAWSTEVGRQPMERLLLDEPVVIYRTEAGVAVAMHGLCPHRLMPLARGQLKGDELECAYHGFCFDPQGRCSKVPTQAQAPAQFRQRVYPTREAGGMVWIWMGAPESAQAVPLPDILSAGMGAEGWVASGHSHIALKARWPLLVDNLFDLSHIGWVHAKSIPASDLVMVPPTLTDTPTSFVVRREMKHVPIDGFNRWLHPHASEFVNASLYSELLGVAVINAGSTTHDAATGQLLGNTNFIHIITPETAHSTHYFGCVTRDFRLDDMALSGALGGQDNRVRAEDQVTLEAIEPWVDRFANTRKELSAQVDAGALRLRRRLDEMLLAEQANAAGAKAQRMETA